MNLRRKEWTKSKMFHVVIVSLCFEVAENVSLIIGLEFEIFLNGHV